MPEKGNKNLANELKNAFKEPSEKMVKVLNEINKTTEKKIGDLAKSQKSYLKGFVEKESPLLGKTFKFFKEGKKREKLKAIFQAKTMGPVMVKGLSLGLLKFGIGGALGAAKIIDVADSYQDYVKDADAEKKKEMLNLVDELRTGENPKTMDEIREVLKKQGVKSFEMTDIMSEYQTTLDERMKDIVTQGAESGKSSKKVLKELVSKGAIDNKIAIERADIDKKRYELEKQSEQNEQLRHLELVGTGKDEKKDGGLFSGFKGFKTALSSAIPLIKGLGSAGLVAGAAFAGFKLGGEINKGINKMVSFLTGTEGETFGGWLYDVTHPDEKGGGFGKKLSGEKAYARGGMNYDALQRAKKAGFKVKADTTTGDLLDFNRKRADAIREQQAVERQKTKETKKTVIAAKEKPSLQKEVAKAETNKIKAEKERKDKEMSVFEKFTDEEAIAKITAQALKEMNINVGGGGSSKLDKIPSNSDDLQLAYMSKGGAS